MEKQDLAHDLSKLSPTTLHLIALVTNSSEDIDTLTAFILESCADTEEKEEEQEIEAINPFRFGFLRGSGKYCFSILGQVYADSEGPGKQVILDAFTDYFVDARRLPLISHAPDKAWVR